MKIGPAVATAATLLACTIALAGCGAASDNRPPYPHGPYGVLVAPPQGVKVAPGGQAEVKVRCAKACHGTLTLIAPMPGKPDHLRQAPITAAQPFAITALSGATVPVRVHIDHPGLVALSASHGHLVVTAVMRYFSSSGARAETDTYRVELHE